ncbi:hypothetical protein ElyMa_002112600 [Elysia marginata]|uniref:Uncharacterized protein n=1 Tax=Elysia marginata TaxID=1093978 RepID=A0AAV4FGJ6_9GAST|nr:hypothetical protein ElyMa_002112600 [Elysia marginata]
MILTRSSQRAGIESDSLEADSLISARRFSIILYIQGFMRSQSEAGIPVAHITLGKRGELLAPQLLATAASLSTTAVPSTERGATSAHAAATKQMTLEAVIERTIKYKPGSTRKKEIDACVLQLITTDLQPLSIADNKAFAN